MNNVLSYGTIAGLLIVVARAGVYLLDVNQYNISYNVLNFLYNLVILFLFMYIATIVYRKKYRQGFLTYWQGFLSCMSSGVIVVIIVYAYDLVFNYLIAPDYLSNMIEPQITAIVNSQGIHPAQKVEILKSLSKYSSPIYVSSINAAISIAIAFVISLITSIFTIKRKLIA
jgi:hypothetical protein